MEHFDNFFVKKKKEDWHMGGNCCCYKYKTFLSLK